MALSVSFLSLPLDVQRLIFGFLPEMKFLGTCSLYAHLRTVDDRNFGVTWDHDRVCRGWRSSVRCIASLRLDADVSPAALKALPLCCPALKVRYSPIPSEGWFAVRSTLEPP